MLLASVTEEHLKSESESWTNDLPLRLTHFGLKATEVKRTFKDSDSGDDQVVLQYYQLTSERLLLPDPVVDQLTTAFKDRLQPLPVLTYLATRSNDSTNRTKSPLPFPTVY